MANFPIVPKPRNPVPTQPTDSSNLHMDIVKTLSEDQALKAEIESQLKLLSTIPNLSQEQMEEREVYTQALIKLNKAIKTKETLLGKMNTGKNKNLQEQTPTVYSSSFSGIETLIHEIVQRELSLQEALFLEEEIMEGIGSGNWFRKPKPEHQPHPHAKDLAHMSPPELKAMLNNLVTKKHGQANLKRSDMELLDKLTKWMKLIPGGTSYRRGLAKYVRSKREKDLDPYRDFRRYSYDQSGGEMHESPEGIMPNEKEVFYHGTSFGNLKPGSLILPPSKTGKQSEKDRKKNLDQVFFTKDPRSALVYAGRAAQSLGGTAAVYVVEPQGPVSLLNATEGTTVYYAPYAKVIRPASKDELAKKKKV